MNVGTTESSMALWEPNLHTQHSPKASFIVRKAGMGKKHCRKKIIQVVPERLSNESKIYSSNNLAWLE